MSGVWERLVRSVQKAMDAVLSKPGAAIPLETLRTVFAEVTSIPNSRPSSPASDDPSDMEPLTPNHLLLQRRNLAIPPVSSPRKSCTHASSGDMRNSLLTVFGRDGF